MRVLLWIALSAVFLSGSSGQVAKAGPLLEMAEEHPEIFEGPFTPLETPCNNGSGPKDCFAYSLTEMGISPATSASIAALVFTLIYAAMAWGAYWVFRNRKKTKETIGRIYKSKAFRAICIFHLIWCPTVFFASDNPAMFVVLLIAPLSLLISARLLYKWYKLGQ